MGQLRQIFKSGKYFLSILICICVQFPIQAQDSLDIDIFELPLEDLLKINVTTASRQEEVISDAPANVIVLTQKDIRTRGYTELTEIFDDLPGMDIAKPYGSTFFKNYWRGFRNVKGSPYLLMLDGTILNHLWFNETQVISQVPITNIKRIEIVYGPASSLYGPNAAMGVINIITSDGELNPGSHFTGKTELTHFGEFRGDYTMGYEQNKFSASVSVKIDSYDAFAAIDLDSYEYTRETYTLDRALWGDFVDSELITGPKNFVRNRGFDFRTTYGDFEFGYQLYQFDVGYGLEYPFDKVQPNVRWLNDDQSAFMRFSTSLNPRLNSTSLIRYRENNARPDIAWLEGYNLTNNTSEDVVWYGDVVAPGESMRVVDYSYWLSENSSWSLFQDFDYTVKEDKMKFAFGYKYEYKDLQKAYQTNYGPVAQPSDIQDPIDASNPYSISVSQMIPDQVATGVAYWNRIVWEDHGLYGLGKFNVSKNHIVNAGVRFDNNSTYGSAVTLRGGYVGHFEGFTAKVLFGQGYIEPNPRSLYGGWTGTGSDPNLDPERSQTLEMSLAYQKGPMLSSANFYYVINTNTVFNLNNGAARNLGDRSVVGLDFNFSTVLQPTFMKSLRLWSYPSFILAEEEEKFDGEGTKIGNDRIGDLAYIKLMGGVTAEFNEVISLNARFRYIGERKTVPTNPVATIDDYFVADLNLLIRNVIEENISFGVKVNNLLDEQYFHPGLQSADAGTTPGVWTANGLGWNGSQSWSNSLLPQPGRMVSFSMYFDF